MVLRCVGTKERSQAISRVHNDSILAIMQNNTFVKNAAVLCSTKKTKNHDNQMKRTLSLTLAVAFALTFTNSSRASVILTDIGATPPTPGPDDIYMTDESDVQEVPGLNYYSNGGNGTPICAGELFTTAGNTGGYILNSVAVLAGGSGGGGITYTPQTWYLRLYSYNSANSNATLIATYSSQPFTFSEGDWLQFTGVGAGLAPNSTYVYTVQNGGAGYELLGGEDVNNMNAGNQAVLVPAPGGTVNFSSAAPAWQADFLLGLSLNTGLLVNPPGIATPGNVYPNPENAFATNTSVTIDCGSVLGSGTYSFQWQTDGGSGGTLTNMPGVNTSNAVVNVASTIGTFKYDVVVGNGSVTVTSAVVQLYVAYPTVGASLVDEGSNYVLSPYYPSISQLTGYGAAGSGDGLNYYDNNPAHPGQTFTTGTNGQGYLLTSVQIQTDPFSNQGGSGGTQPYYLYIYSINTNSGFAQIIQAYTNGSAQFTKGDWLQWSGLNVTMAPNAVYGYTFANNPNVFSYCGMYASATNNYTGGQLCLVDPVSGLITFDGTDPATNNSAVFYLQFSAIGQQVPNASASAIMVSPASGVPGTQFTLTEAASGASPLSYFWLTDGGSGGALMNIPENNASNLVLNTTGWNPGVYSYQVIVSNALNTATSSVVSVPVLVMTSTAANGILTDIGNNAPTPGMYDISQTNGVVGGYADTPPGINYYVNNGQPPGETFTTGNNPGGYVLESAAIQLGTDDAYSSWPAGGQPYLLNIYRIYNDQGGQYAQLYETITSQNNFVLTVGASEGHWLQWTGLTVIMQPNTKYAYSFGNVPNGAGYINLVAGSNTPAYYSGGQVALLPGSSQGYSGQVQFSSATGWNGTFDLGLSLATVPVTLSITKSVGGQLQVQWTGGILEQASSVNGPWTTNISTSPYTFSPTGLGQFFRVLQQ